MSKKQKRMLVRIIVTSVLMIALQFLQTEGLVRFALYMVPYLVIGYDILRKAAIGIWKRQVFDENFLMAVATVGAIIIGISSSGDYVEAVAVMLFYQIGEWFQSYAVGKSRRNISELMDIRPDYANLESDGEIQTVDPDEVEIGSIIVVRPGEKVPIDGVVVEGNSSLDTSALTGESLPRGVTEGDEITSGSINLTGVLRIRTTKEFGESTVAKILDLVENASFRKSRSEDFISKFAKVYTPAVCYGALALAFLPPLVRLLLGSTADFGVWFYRALTFLVVSCPCALVISIPLTFFAGIGGASRAGILIKGSNFIETLSMTEQIVFDKTGTLTRGVFEVTEIYCNNTYKYTLLDYAAHTESSSLHPVSRSISAAYGRNVDLGRVKNVSEISGKGVTAEVDGRNVAVGNAKLMKQLGISYTECGKVGTVVYVALDGEFIGYIVIADVIKDNSPKAVKVLKTLGIKRIIMLTGDNKTVADNTAEMLGIEEVYSDLLPADKVEKVEQFLDNNSKRGKLAFVGDGINDAPVLSRADVGVAMGGIGSDAAIEAADIVLMDDDPMKLVQAIKISRKCIRIVYQNSIFAIGIKLACLLLAAIGFANMWLAIFADVGVMVIAVLNAIRALYTKPRNLV